MRSLRGGHPSIAAQWYFRKAVTLHDPNPRADSTSGAVGAADLFRAHADFVAGFVQRLGVRAEEVDDVVQEVFMVAHRKGGYTPGPAAPRSWLGAIAVRLAADQRRRTARSERPMGAAEDLPLCDARTPERAADARGALNRVQAALDTLSLEHRAVFVLFDIEGERAASIATALGVPEGTVYSRIHHARRSFLQAYEATERP